MVWDLLSLTGDLALLMWLAAAVFWGLAGGALASWLGRSIWRGAALGAALPIVGAVVQLVRAGIRRGTAGTPGGALRPRPSWPGLLARVGVATVAVLAAAALVVVTDLADTHLGVAGVTRLSLTVRDVGLATVTVVTVVVLAIAAVVSWLRPSRAAAVAVAWCASWWLLWGLAAMLVGDTLRVLVDSTGLADAVDAEFTVGLSWTLVLAVAAVLLVWSAAVIVLADRRAGAGQTTTGWPTSAGTVPSPALPAQRGAADPFAPAADPFAVTANPYAATSDPFAGPSQQPRPVDPFSGGR
jgi:hypothetical protein